MMAVAIVQTALMVNECWVVAVTSEAMDGVALALNPGWVHRRKNSNNTAR